ncbi:hypothetical protein ABIB56_003696, partial [Glaciihabitans sp. UYNi722]
AHLRSPPRCCNTPLPLPHPDATNFKPSVIAIDRDELSEKISLSDERAVTSAM